MITSKKRKPLQHLFPLFRRYHFRIPPCRNLPLSSAVQIVIWNKVNSNTYSIMLLWIYYHSMLFINGLHFTISRNTISHKKALNWKPVVVYLPCVKRALQLGLSYTQLGLPCTHLGLLGAVNSRTFETFQRISEVKWKTSTTLEHFWRRPSSTSSTRTT